MSHFYQDFLRASRRPRSPHRPVPRASSPCKSAWACVTSDTWSAMPLSVCTRPDAASMPICAFRPKCQSFPFFDWYISGSRFWSLVDGGAAINVASTIVPSRIIKPCAARWVLIVSKIYLSEHCFKANAEIYAISSCPGPTPSRFG